MAEVNEMDVQGYILRDPVNDQYFGGIVSTGRASDCYAKQRWTPAGAQVFSNMAAAKRAQGKCSVRRFSEIWEFRARYNRVKER